MLSPLLALVSLAFLPAPALPAPSALVRQASQGFDERFDKAKGDLASLWDLWLWCEAGEHTREGRKVLRAILELNPDYRPAREALGHEFHDGRWFESKKELERYLREEEERQARERGLVRWKDRWVAPSDLPFLERGMVRDANGGWLTREEQAKLSEGWVRQDLAWIPPADATKVEQGLWLCGEQWLDTAQADEWHSDVDRWWRVPVAGFVLYSTCSRATIGLIAEHLGRTLGDLERIYGTKPFDAPVVVVLSSPRQYERWGKGQIPAGATPADSRELSIVYHAFFADRAHDPLTSEPLRCGVGYWDASSESGANFGLHSVRHAAGLSWASALEQQWSAKPSEGKRKKKRAAQEQPPALPDWFRYGAASYVERWFVDTLTAVHGDPYWARTWSKKNLTRRSEPLSMNDFFAFRMNPEAIDLTQRWLNEAGMVIAFVLETELEDVRRAHAALKQAFVAGVDVAPALDALQAALIAHGDEVVALARE